MDSSRHQGYLLVLEGPDGVGKSTLAELLVAELSGAGVAATGLAFPGNTPGTLGSLTYRIHHDLKGNGIEDVAPSALQLMHLAAHVDAIERQIRPAVLSGTTVVIDRFWWSMWVYGRAAGLPQEYCDAMVTCEETFWGSLLPDQLWLIDRNAPWREEEKQDMSGWTCLRDLYRDLGIRSHRYPVTTLRNDGEPVEVIRSALRASPFGTLLG